MALFRNKYRQESTRLRSWDYGTNAAYFVTICTKDRISYFGKIEAGEMHLTKIGQITQAYWADIPTHFPFVKLDAFVMMPNHVHGIIIIDKPPDVETQNFASLHARKPSPRTNQQSLNQFGPQSQNLASIIRGYKAGVKKYATMHDIDFHWQPRFHDYIIRNENSLHQIQQYIVANPLKWETDRYYKHNHR